MYKTKPVLLLFVLLLGMTIAFTGCKPKDIVSTSQEIDIGKQASQDVERQYPVNRNPQLNATINQIGQALAQCSDRRDITYTFKILDVKDVNAFSLPGGWIYINKGLIDATQGKPDQLAGVIAHEIGHVAARHHAEMMGREVYANVLIGTLTQGQTQQLASVFANLSLLRWSRKQEYDSDRLGIKYMYRCRQYDAQGLVNFFNTLLKIQPDRPSGFEQIFRTHPVTSERIKRAQTYLDDLRAGRASAQ